MMALCAVLNCGPDAALFASPEPRKRLKRWYARQDSNLRPSAPEADALSRLSYGRTKVRIQCIMQAFSKNSMQAEFPTPERQNIGKNRPLRHCFSPKISVGTNRYII